MGLIDDYRYTYFVIAEMCKFYMSFFTRRVDYLVLLVIRDINRVQKNIFEIQILLDNPLESIIASRKKFVKDALQILKHYRITLTTQF